MGTTLIPHSLITVVKLGYFNNITIITTEGRYITTSFTTNANGITGKFTKLK